MEQPQARLPFAEPSPRAVNLLIGVLCLIWGSTWFVIKIGLQDLPPFTAGGTRFLLAAAGMALVARLLREREGGRAPAPWLSLCMGLFQFSISYGIVYWSETILPSGLVCVLWSTYPLMIAVAGHFFISGERLRPIQALGFVVGFVGVGSLYFTDIGALGEDSMVAAAILLFSPLTVTVGTVILKRHATDVSSILLNRNGMVVGGVLLLLAAWLTEQGADVRWTAAAVGSVAYLAVVGSVIAFGLYFWLMRFARATRLSVIAYVTPVVALSLGAVAGDEPLGINTVTGTGLILLGVWMSHRRYPTSKGASPVGEPATQE
jgi:drug/metabolite transporter (DMT)-like permease